ncbi:MAG: methylated-DNA--[protein]-cysteine S-methyltransferase [Bdellovibrionales bacterium]|nr:methylated-DNA--[protein]-cysteine S-methyltransferase [Bdellovibrionales bacterium]
MKNQLAQWKMKTQIGDIYLVASEKGLKALIWKEQAAPYIKDIGEKTPQAEFLRQTIREITEYFDGKRTSFAIPLDVEGTEFQSKVWKELAKIPYGKTTSYKKIAGSLKTKGVRAVGTANGRNPISIIVPCHRVIASDGTLGGYAGGLPAKQALLDLERKVGSPGGT